MFGLLNAVRGMSADPLSNVRRALGEVHKAYADVPVGLVGHSLGGSVALAAADQDGVVCVVALAPWLAGSESVSQLTSSDLEKLAVASRDEPADRTI